MMVISDQLNKREYPDLQERFRFSAFGSAITLGVLYAVSSGTCHSAQWALTAMFKAANEGRFNFVESVKEYGEKAKVMKKLFLENGFCLVYDKDMDEPIADGFYFTISYPGMSGGDLLYKFLYYGISAITLSNTGSNEEGLRACVSFVQRNQFPDLEERLKLFRKNNPV